MYDFYAFSEHINSWLIDFLLAGCHNISCINISASGLLEPDPLQHSRHLFLQYLDMTDCYGLHDPGLKVIVKNCPQLLHLYLRRCINITGNLNPSTKCNFYQSIMIIVNTLFVNVNLWPIVGIQ